MKIPEELREQIREALAKAPPYPDLEALIASGDLRKARGGGYNVLTSAGYEAIKGHLSSVMSPHDKTKPAVFKLHRRRKS
ncbi:hypothetical protein F9Z43_14840 [Pseudomonas monteilii]|uniref:Uncharacterized protein n=1 Tax=Pseudomonas monteilii TaxID=76759 RepID=A0A7X3JRW2_9PSED|nr:hypothetical protein [Pseudomonas monteilii]MVF50570.1 hypothetical protein [Pseudomonas monteilii]